MVCGLGPGGWLHTQALREVLNGLSGLLEEKEEEDKKEWGGEMPLGGGYVGKSRKGWREIWGMVGRIKYTHCTNSRTIPKTAGCLTEAKYTRGWEGLDVYISFAPLSHVASLSFL